jgi:hypothetical protein
MNEQQIIKDISCLLQWKDTTEVVVEDMRGDIKEIKDSLLRRPSWATLAIITFLSSTSIGLLVAFLTKR